MLDRESDTMLAWNEARWNNFWSSSFTVVRRRKRRYTVLMMTRIVIVTAVMFLVRSSFAQEHPEHPKAPPTQASDQKQTTKAVENKQVTTAQISTGIKKHITAETNKSSDKKFHAKHQGKDLALNLVKVHDDRLSGLGGGKYFACVDMKATDGVTYDIDFFLSGTPDNMKVTETSVHKVNGKALYSWKEEGGVWKKTPAS